MNLKSSAGCYFAALGGSLGGGGGSVAPAFKAELKRARIPVDQLPEEGRQRAKA